MTNSESKRLLKKWQKRLRLTDWAIALHVDSTPGDFIEQDRCGEVEYIEENKTAVIRIIRAEYYGNRVTPFSFEQTLVHELLHLKFALLDDSENKLQNRLVHQMIEELSKAFTEEPGNMKR